MSEEKKIDAPPEVIAPPYRPFYQMRSETAIPVANHNGVDPFLAAKQKPAALGKAPDSFYARGKIVKHVPSGQSVTIIKCNGIPASGTVPEYIVISKKGKKWVAKETDLAPRLLKI